MIDQTVLIKPKNPFKNPKLLDIKGSLNEINKGKLMKNLLLLSLTHPADSTIDILIEKIMKKNNILDNIASLTDMFAKNQKVIILK